MRRLLSAALLALVTAACGADAATPPGAEPPPTTSTTSTTSTTAAPATTTTASPTTVAPSPTTPTTVAPAAPRLSASSRLGVDGLGPIQVGMTVDQARAVAGVELVTESTPYCTIVTAPDGPPGVTLIVSTPASGRIDLIIVKDPPVATISGIRVGSSEAEVRATYGDRVRAVNPSLPVHRLVYDAGDRVVVFVISESRVASMYSGLRDQAEADEICA